MGPVAPFRFAIRPSASLTAFLFFGHALALAVAVLLPLSALSHAGLAAAVLVSLGWQVRQGRRPVVIGLEIGPGAALSWQGVDGAWQTGSLRGQSLVLPYLVLLRVGAPEGGRTVSLVLPPDAVGEDAHRQLRRWLLWAGSRLPQQRTPASD
ncbi:hypothetical protein DLREEDagrD3_18270 [Denitratisoma sp. agr-D3]